jgi:hypothetical protein
LKGPINLLLNVVVADYALIAGAYNSVILIASLIEKRRKECTSSFDGISHTCVANYCEECIRSVHGEESTEDSDVDEEEIMKWNMKKYSTI